MKEVLARLDLDSIIVEAGDYIKVLTIADNDEGFDLLPNLLRCDPLDGQKPSTGFAGDAEASLTQYPDDNLGLLARGLSNKEFGRELGVAEETVKLHVTTLIKPLVVNNRILADVKAAFLGFIPDHPNTPYETG